MVLAVIRVLAGMAGLLAMSAVAPAGEVRVLTAGAFKAVLLAAQPGFEASSGHKLAIDNATAGGIVRRIGAGEAFDIVVAPPSALDALVASGKLVADSRRPLARSGIGVAVKEGAAKPDIGTLDAFKTALRNAKTVAYVDPDGGGSSGIYLMGMFERLGMADEIKAKARLQRGGYVADLVVSGEAELALHQISEILPVKGAVLVGPLPPEVQNFTTYGVAITSQPKEASAADAFWRYLASEPVAQIITSRGMDRLVGR